MTLVIPFALWAPRWRKEVLRTDLLEGLTRAIIVLPRGVVPFATLAGMPPALGLYWSMVPCIAAALFGRSRLILPTARAKRWLARKKG